MATITVSVASAQGTVNMQKTIADADLGRVVAAMGSSLDFMFQPQYGPDGQQLAPATPKTNANIIRAWINNWLRMTKQEVLRYEQRSTSLADQLTGPGLPIADA